MYSLHKPFESLKFGNFLERIGEKISVSLLCAAHVLISARVVIDRAMCSALQIAAVLSIRVRPSVRLSHS